MRALRCVQYSSPSVVRVLLACLIVAGCSFTYRVIAVYHGASVYFVKEEGGKGTGCLSNFSITSENGDVVWKISRDAYQAPPCQSTFPLEYGSAPKGFTVEIPPQTLKHGVRYRIDGWDGDTAEGGFVYKLRTG